MKMNDNQGCSICKPGEERFEYFCRVMGSPFAPKKELIHYDYRTPDGELFSCTADTLKDARTLRDAWLKRRKER